MGGGCYLELCINCPEQQKEDDVDPLKDADDDVGGGGGDRRTSAAREDIFQMYQQDDG